jgi:hypothetical protein
MYENLIQNSVRMIPWEDFWEPAAAKQRWIKWCIIALVLLLSISVFLLTLDDIQTYEYARRNPIIVEAERELVYKHDTYHDIYISYTCNGVKYSDVYYGTSKNPGIRWDGVETITVAVAPNDPGIPIRNMFNPEPILLGAMLWAIGLSMLIYGIAIEFSSFRQWRVKQANKPGFLRRPYGKPNKYTANPDYLTDFVVIFVPLAIISLIILGFSFPYTFSN